MLLFYLIMKKNEGDKPMQVHIPEAQSLYQYADNWCGDVAEERN